jgi:hypothetical protein
MIMKNYHKSLIFLCIALLFFEGIIFYFSMNRPLWGDESHFVNTINQFGKDMSIDTIKHYNEMSTPLPFILYSVWGRIFSFDLQILRIFSVIIALSTYLLFYNLLLSIFKDIKVSLLTTAFIVVHPYMIGLSVFVFTDMLAILFIITSCISIRKQSPIYLSLSLACGLLCRQYLIFFVLTAGLYYLGIYYNYKKRKQDTENIIPMLWSCFVSLVPLTILAVLWKGLSPDNDLVKYIYLDDAYRFHPSYFTLYVCQLFIYLVPVILIFWKTFYNNKKTIIFSLIASSFYWLFPVRACKCAIDVNIDTVGFFHKFIRIVFENQFIEDIIFYLAFLMGLPILIFIVKDIYYKWQAKTLDFSFLLDLSVILFLVVMPFSYLCWEKYFLPLLPLVTMRILLTKYYDNGLYPKKEPSQRVEGTAG